MVKIRLYRTGTTKRPTYRIVAIDSRKKRQGRVLETLGTYQPRRDGAVTLDDAAYDLWVGRGAQVSDTVRNMVQRHRKGATAADEAGGAAESTESAPAAS